MRTLVILMKMILEFCYLLDESLKDAWDRLLRIRASYVPQYQIEVYLKSFYVGLPASFEQVLDSIFEGGFLEGDPIDTYERMKTIFGHPLMRKLKSHLFCFLTKTNLLKR